MGIGLLFERGVNRLGKDVSAQEGIAQAGSDWNDPSGDAPDNLCSCQVRNVHVRSNFAQCFSSCHMYFRDHAVSWESLGPIEDGVFGRNFFRPVRSSWNTNYLASCIDASSVNEEL